MRPAQVLVILSWQFNRRTINH